MARRIKSRKRKHLGNRFYGGGNAKNRRGKGNKGGKGNAGAHKHKWLRTIKLGLHKHRKYGFASVRGRLRSVTLERLATWIAKGRFPSEGGFFKVVLKDCKVIGSGVFSAKAVIEATAFSASAVKKIEASGGKVISETAAKGAANEVVEEPSSAK